MKYYNFKTGTILFSMLLCFGLFAQGPPGGGQGGRRGGGQGPQDQSGGGKPDASQIMERLDTNSDGQIDEDEASQDERGHIKEHFETIDTNGDAFIDLDELEASLNNKKPKKVSAKKILKEVDDDGDKKLNELEVAAKGKSELSKHFNEIDTNNDHALDLDELKVFYAKADKPQRRGRD
ncbi:EF-hand domain-containing protein [Algibacter mikhailovii]|uniref:EF-hand domain-containing protein n=1 Tax=Algibacter mikhailovii TaxID=425498 RepID=A0A918R4E4_9FLAO|nr:EF-hand domain-containing protein [Algibacter mikhailovii]GGZ82792.1 hypothetical protein GCM10007028_20790 [Algibacter mikhailovii]